MEKLYFHRSVEKDYRMNRLTDLELAILEKVGESYPVLKMHIPYIRAKDREFTRVGAYINLTYLNAPGDLIPIEPNNKAISSNESLEVDSLEHGLAYEVDILNGKANFIELVSYGEEWDGNYSNFSFIVIP